MADIKMIPMDFKRLGDIKPDGSIRLIDNNRDYRRIKQSARDVLYLEQLGFTEVMSSNVSAVMRESDDLLIRFHNGGIYRYFKQGYLFDDIMRSNSKGRWTWQNLRWKQVPFRYEGKILTPSGYQSTLTYEQIGEQLSSEYTKFNIPIQDSTEDILKTLINLYSSQVKLNSLELFDVMTILKNINGPIFPSP